jgi:type I restriction enzyme S subunit
VKSAAHPHVNLRDIRQFAVPTPLADQRRIVAYLDGLSAKAEALKQLQAATAAELDALLPSVLDKAFKGDL